MTELMHDHGPMLRAAHAVSDELARMESHMSPGDVSHQWHTDFAIRAQRLSLHLTAILRLVEIEAYSSAFALLRTALEHHLVDQLVFLGRRYVQVFDGLTDEQWESLISDYESGSARTRRICETPTRSRKGRVTVVREGLYASEDDPATQEYTISPIYFAIREYRPFTGRPGDQTFLDDGLLDIDRRVEQAHRQKELWEQHLTWSSIVANLELNGFYSAEELRQLQVHYRFLSAFAHGTHAAYELAYGRGILRSNPPLYDHYSSELALLYLNAIGARELEALLDMTQRPPLIDVPDRRELIAVADVSRQLSRHLWFPGDTPHQYDRVVEANRRVWRNYRDAKDLTKARNHAVTPDALQPEDVGYYDNPHRRLVELHQTSQEMTTGFRFLSPWERHDARFR